MNKLIQNKVNGILVDHPNAAAFTKNMNFLVKNLTIWESLARRAHQIAKEKYSWKNTISIL